ncbi:hypothetical protein [Roseibium sp. MMSF_3544]|uniref:hypothetical protein n=1 Tax=unclassified Roseibium TaxID=2629323 RepID=UPI00273E54D8|nr:hypothetical protein [Roseibium sp. MMSF_3544]
MVEIFSKKDGPRREDVAAKRLINENRTTIHRLADQISNGGFTRSRQLMKQAREEPKPDGLVFHFMDNSPTQAEPEPRLRRSPNGRVFVMDTKTGKQMLFLGEFRDRGAVRYFALATKQNGFISPVDADIEDTLATLDGVVIETAEIEEKLLEVIRERLQVP